VYSGFYPPRQANERSPFVALLAEALSQKEAAPIERDPWVALTVRPRLERPVQQRLTNAGLETFVPWHGVRRRWSDRVKVVEENLFPGYVFCRSRFADRRMVMGHPGVSSVVSFNHTPATIPDVQIDALRLAIQSGLSLGPWPFLKVGQKVRIERGVLAGLEGLLSRNVSAWNLVVSVDALRRSFAIEIERDLVRPI
jgi:transcription antitermination factor NusG